MLLIQEPSFILVPERLVFYCLYLSQIKVPYQYCTVINNLRRNKNLAVLKQDKGRGVVILDKNKYIEKCISIVTGRIVQKIGKQSYSNMWKQTPTNIEKN